MKKTLKKLVSIILVGAMLVSLTSCVIPQKMEKVIGTYKLTRYSKNYNDTTPTVVYDEGTEWDVYMVVTGNSNGWMVDNEAGEWVARPIALSYEYDTEKPDKLAYVHYTDTFGSDPYECKVTGNTLTWTKYGWITTSNNGTPLNPFDDKRAMTTTTRTYSRQDDATDLSWLKKQVGQIDEYTKEEYEYDKVYDLEYYAYPQDTSSGAQAILDPYVYSYVDLHLRKGNATWYYALKEDREQRIETKQITVSQDYKKVTLWDGMEFENTSGSGYTYKTQKTIDEVVYDVSYYLNAIDILSPKNIQNRCDADIEEYNRNEPMDGVEYLTHYEVEVQNPDGTPARGVEVQLYNRYTKSIDENGKAIFEFNSGFRADVYKIYVLDWSGQRLEYTGVESGKTNAKTAKYVLKLKEVAPVKADYVFTVTNADGSPAAWVEVRLLIGDYYTYDITIQDEGIATITENAGEYAIELWKDGKQLDYTSAQGKKTSKNNLNYNLQLKNNV